jgi:predicted TIM-barrel fold metal-dependent hydrolase
MDWYFERWGRQAVAIKNVSAYWRVLKYDEVSEADAAPLYEKWLVRRKKVTPAERKAVQDHFFDACVRRATELDLAVKIHTGYHAGTGYTDLNLPRVRDLASLFRRHPKARFDVFHLSYPEWDDVIALAKHYPNVVADMCWAWAIDPQGARQFARQALHALPLNKVHGFGGDVGYADMVYGHSRIARDGIALVLTEAVREGRLTRADAKAAARRWLRENAMEFYRIEKRRAAQAAGQPPALAP